MYTRTRCPCHINNCIYCIAVIFGWFYDVIIRTCMWAQYHFRFCSSMYQDPTFIDEYNKKKNKTRANWLVLHSNLSTMRIGVHTHDGYFRWMCLFPELYKHWHVFIWNRLNMRNKKNIHCTTTTATKRHTQYEIILFLNHVDFALE